MKKRPATKSAPEMSQAQTAYALAVAAYETAKSAAKAECAEKGLVIVDGMSDEVWETTNAAIDDVEIAHDVWKLHTLRIEAERAMILWSVEAGARLQPQGAAAFTFIRERVEQRKVLHGEWKKLVDIAFRLHA